MAAFNVIHIHGRSGLVVTCLTGVRDPKSKPTMAVSVFITKKTQSLVHIHTAVSRSTQPTGEFTAQLGCLAQRSAAAWHCPTFIRQTG